MPPTDQAGTAARAAATAPAIGAGSKQRWLLDIADFRRLWLIGLVVFAVRWLEMLVVGVFVYQRTGSAFEVALMTLKAEPVRRMAPMVLFGPLLGAVAERLQRHQSTVLDHLPLGVHRMLDRPILHIEDRITDPRATLRDTVREIAVGEPAHVTQKLGFRAMHMKYRMGEEGALAFQLNGQRFARFFE